MEREEETAYLAQLLTPVLQSLAAVVPYSSTLAAEHLEHQQWWRTLVLGRRPGWAALPARHSHPKEHLVVQSSGNLQQLSLHIKEQEVTLCLSCLLGLLLLGRQAARASKSGVL